MTELNSSLLGTKDYWDATYNDEMRIYEESGYPGEIWFGVRSVHRIVKWIVESPLVTENSRVIDLGCGNGITLVELYKKGYCNLVGVDYAESAIELAKAIAEKENVMLNYEVCDIIDDKSQWTGCLCENSFNVCIDKGTYDAISLSPSEANQSRNSYIENVFSLLRDSGILIITSCNWTEAELRTHFNKHFHCIGHIATETFSFGGQTGNKETVLILQKNT